MFMATEITNQVVQMKFNNREFEKNVEQTLTSLEKLDNSLKFKNGGEGFTTLSKAVDEVKVKFSALEVVAITALTNITNKAVNAGEKLVKSLSVDNITAGWQKFEDTTTSVGTLISQGFSMEEVEEQLAKLNWFTDETSYNFTEMVSNIGKFTATGQSLEDSVTAMMGIANWAALSGQNATKASMAMYQLSQAMSKGVLKYDDWKSISNASMDTKEFRENAAKAAVAIGTLRKEENGLYTTLKGHTVSLNELFSSDYMSRDAWFTKDVMMKTFRQYSSAVDQIYEAVSSGEFETASEAIAAMGDQVDSFGIKAFKAAQEARTWTDVIASVKDAVSSKWKDTFELIIGNYQEAKQLFTGLANLLYTIFAESGNERNEILALWKGLGGREKLLDGLAAGFYAIKYAIDSIKDAFYEVFSSIDRATRIGNKADKLLSITENFRKVMYSIADFMGRNAKNIGTFFKGIFSVIKLVSDTIVGLFHALIPATKSTGSLFQIILSLAGVVGRVLTDFTEWIRQTNLLSTAMNVLKIVMSVIGNLFLLIISGLAKLGSYIKEFVKAVAKLKPIQTVVKAISYAFALVAASVMTLVENIKQLIITLRSPELTEKSDNPLVKVLAWIKNGLVVIGNVAVLVAKKIVDFIVALRQISFTDIFNSVKEFFGNANDWILTKIFGENEKEGKNLLDVIKQLTVAMQNWIKQLDLGTIVAGAFVISMIGVAGALAKLMNSASGLFGNASNLFKTVNNWIKKTYAKSVGILNIAEAFGILAASLWLLSKVPADDLTRVAWTVGILIGALSGMYLIVAGISKLMMKGEKVVEIEKTFEALANVVRAISFSIVAVAGAMLLLQNVELSWSMVGKLGVVLGVVAVLSAIALGLSALTQLAGKKKFFNIPQIIGMILGILAISLSLKKITQALIDLSNLNTDAVKKGSEALVPLMIGFGALAAGAGQVKLTSVAALYLLIKLMEQVIPELATLAEQTGKLVDVYIDPDAAKIIMGILAGVIISLGIFGKNINKATTGISLLLMSIGALMVLMAKLNASGATILSAQTAGVLLIIAGLIVGIEALAEKTKEAKLIAFAGAMLMLVPVIGSLGLICWGLKKLQLRWEDTIPLQIIMFGIGLLMVLAEDTKNAKFSTLIALFAGLNGIFLEMIALSLIPWQRLLATAGAMSLVMFGLAAVLNSFSKLQRNNTLRQKGDFGKKFKGLILVFVELAAAIASMFAIAKVLKQMQGMDIPGMLTSALALAGMLGILAGITKILSKIEIKDKSSVLGVLGIMGALIIEMIAIAHSLKILAAVPWDDLKGAMIAMNVTLGVLAIVTGVLGKIASTPAGIKALGLGLVVLAAGLGILCVAMKIAVEIFKDFASALTEIQNAVAGDPIGNIINQIISGAQTILNNAEALKTSLYNIGKYMVEGIVLGVNDNLYLAWNAGARVADAYDKGLRGEAIIASPSKVQYNNGVFMVLGMIGGVLDNLGKAKASGAAMSLSAVAGTIENVDKAYVAGAAVGGATVEGYDNAMSEAPKVAEETIIEIEDEVVPKVAEIASETENITSLSINSIKKMVKEGHSFTMAELKAMSAEQRKAVQEAAALGLAKSSKITWFDKVNDKIVDAWNNSTAGTLYNLVDSAKPYINGEKSVSDAVSGIAKKVLGDDAFGTAKTQFGDYLAGIKEELGLSDGQSYFEQILGEDGGTSLLANATDGISSFGSAAEKTTDILADLKDTIENQMDLFSEFNLQTEMTAEDMLHNMASQILGIQGWADNMTVLAARGMDQGLLEMLGNMGPQAYEKVMAFAQMTDEQLQEANNLYRMSTKLPGSAANQVFAGYTYAGEMAAKGFSNALDQYWGLIDPEAMGRKTIEDIAAGMTDYTHVRKASGGAGTAAKNTFNENAPNEEDGKTSMEKVSIGIAAGGVAVVAAVQEVRKQVEEEERLLMESLSKYNYDSTNAPKANASARGFESSTSGIGGEGLSEETKKKLGISDTISISEEPIPKSATITMTPILNLSQIKTQAAQLDNTFGTTEVQLAANGIDKRIEASRQMENKILTEAFQTANKNTFDKFSRDVCAAITSTEKPVNVNVVLQGDAQEVFKMVRTENSRFTRINGFNPLTT